MTNGNEAQGSAMISCLSYIDADAAVAWLGKAFGFAEHAIHRGADGRIVHAELAHERGMIMVGPQNAGEFGRRFMTLPRHVGMRETQAVYVIVANVAAHHDRAKAAGAEIVMPLETKSYGGESYAARDPEGHVWSFGSYDPWAAVASA